MRNHGLCEFCVDAPVSALIGIGQRVARHPATNAYVIELVLVCLQTCFDITQALMKGELGATGQGGRRTQRLGLETALSGTRRGARHATMHSPRASHHRRSGRPAPALRAAASEAELPYP